MTSTSVTLKSVPNGPAPESPPAPQGRYPREEGGGGGDREQRLFGAIRGPEGTVTPASILEALNDAGIRENDPRIVESVRLLQSAHGAMSLDDFIKAVRPGLLLLERAIAHQLVIPEFKGFTSEIEALHEATRDDRGGAVADYIPQLGRVDPELYATSLCTIDGQRFSLGDSSTAFCLQSSCKPINYALALEEHGEAVVHQHVGCEPSGQSFNELALNRQGRPHNPMINAGAIMTTSLIRPPDTMADRFDYVLQRWGQAAGGTMPGFSNPTYLSERKTADRNFALGYFMREKGAFPEGTDLVETLEFYFQCCSLELTAEAMSVVAATLANGGVCPLTGERVFQSGTVRKCLSLMSSCGMYDFSGEWAFRVGLPAKSGVSGVIMIVVPNVMGLVCWSPRLDENGNSVRGIEFGKRLVDTFSFHNYGHVVGGHSSKRDPRLQREQVARDLLVDLCWAASEGDVDAIRRLVVQGADVTGADYDGRTPLHLAASEGREDAVRYLLVHGASAGATDRWGNTPVDDAKGGGYDAVIAPLITALSKSGNGARVGKNRPTERT